MVKLSVIVPVYNAENYLSRCLDSLLDQGLGEGEMEIICVDDGSTDESLALLQRYADTYSAIKVFSQQNAGAGEARNIGLAHAEGDVLTFCDADDYLIPNGLRYILDRFWNDQIDVLCHASTTLDAQRLKNWKEENDPTGEIISEGSGRKIYERDPKYFVWNTLIRRTYIEDMGLRFQPMAMAEDACFLLELMMTDPRVIDVSSNIYRYTVNKQQVTRRRDPELMRQCIDAYLCFFLRLRHYDLPGIMKIQKIPFLSRVLSANLDKEEFHKLVPQLKKYDISTCPYFLYVPISWVYRTLFVPYILPLIARGK